MSLLNEPRTAVALPAVPGGAQIPQDEPAMPSTHAASATHPVGDPIAPTRKGREYWRSLDQLAETPEFSQFVEREFPQHASEMLSPFTRRTFLNLMAASIALAGGVACRRPEQRILPYSKMPENMVHGIPQFYATALESGTQALGVVARCFEGRPVKLEGNPDFPGNRGSLDAISQALILELYDPDRARQVTLKGKPAKLEEFAKAAAALVAAHRGRQGAGLAFLSERTTSPTLLALRQRLAAELPQAAWHVWEPVNEDNALAGAALAFGRPLAADYDLERADIVLALDSDLLHSGPAAVLNQKRFARRRRMEEPGATMNRLYVVESMLTLTGGIADHRLRMPADQMAFFLGALAAQLGIGVVAPAGALGPQASKWVEAIARDIQQHPGRVVVVAGESQPPAVHALALALTQRLGAECLKLHEPANAQAAVVGPSLESLAKSLAAGQVQTLVLLGGNPVYDAPADLKFGEALAKAAHTIHLTLHPNETSKACEWVVPRAHQLESWGDVRALDGTIGLQQPLISPLFGGLTATELLSLLGEAQPRKAYDIVFAQYQGAQDEAAFLPAWRKALHDGLLAGSAAAPVAATANIAAAGAALAQLKAAEPLSARNLALQFIADPQLLDGRYANNGWLQEAPHPITKMVWDNAALISDRTAKELGLKSDEVVRLELNGATVDIPVLVLPGVADYVVCVQLGYGRTAGGRIAEGVGVDIYPLRTSAAPWFARGLKLTRTSRTVLLSNVQDHWTLDHDLNRDRPLILEATAEEYAAEGRGVVERAYFAPLEKGPHATHGSGGHDEHGKPIAGHGEPAPVAGSHAELGAAHAPLTSHEPAAMNVAAEAAAGATTATAAVLPETAVAHRFDKAEVYTTDGSSGATPAQKQYNISPFQEHSYAHGQQWGMAIDLSACTGCQACMVACQAENNIPIVGKAQVRNNREMHWIRLDRYFVTATEGQAPDDAEMVYQPMNCQQCENAPCEQVCPVTATTHSPDGINEMTYNRCIGTRYCSNNCPFKVRRFNFFNYHEGHTYDGGEPSLVKMASNPNVTVRMRGVMEKCTFCVQRVRRAAQDAKVAGRAFVDGDAKSACQQTCPSEAIVFGDINDPKSMVTLAKTRDRNYELLSWLNVKPRVSYLARLRNPNPELLA